jgi:divalent metal cation (Fe/Co/Zn/Cd) transporter
MDTGAGQDDRSMKARQSSGEAATAMPSVMRWGWYSLAVNVVLLGIHGAIAAASGSLAVTAESIHNFVDLVSAGAVLAGLKLAARKTKDFPYALYKVENLVAAGIAIMVFAARTSAWRMAREATTSMMIPNFTSIR